MALLLCSDVGNGLRDAEATVTIREHDGSPQHFPIDRGMLAARDGQYFLSVGVIHVDKTHGIVLVSLPVEADSGASRIWVKQSDIWEREAVSA